MNKESWQYREDAACLEAERRWKLDNIESRACRGAFVQGVHWAASSQPTEPPVAIDDDWISVEDRLPENNENVLCFEPLWKRQVQQSYSEGCDQDSKWFKRSFTHWRPLFKPPKQ